MVLNQTVYCLRCLLAGIQRPAIRQMRATGEPACAMHALEGLPAAYEQRKVGRNDPCHCESGKKFKDCHGTAKAIRERSALKIEIPKPPGQPEPVPVSPDLAQD